MNVSHKALCSALLAASLGLVAAEVWAQDMAPPDQQKMENMKEGMHGKMGMHGKNMEGMHAMPATVTSVDKTTGIVEATSEGMTLRVHFPAAAMANLKEGDKITLHMGFSKSQ